MAKAPVESELKAALGASAAIWPALVRALEAEFGPLEQAWRPTKLDFGRICLLRQGDRTLVYLLPGDGRLVASLVLGDRACERAMASDLPAAVKKSLAGAPACAAGHGIRFPMTAADVPVVVKLVAFKTAPK